MDSRAAQIFSEILTTYRVSRFFSSSLLAFLPSNLVILLVLQSRGVLVHFAHTLPSVYKTFEKSGIVKAIGADYFHK